MSKHYYSQKVEGGGFFVYPLDLQELNALCGCPIDWVETHAQAKSLMAQLEVNRTLAILDASHPRARKRQSEL